MAKAITKARVSIANTKTKSKALGVRILHTTDMRGYGEEPVFDRLLTAKELGWALTWYSSNMDDKTGIGFAVQYLTKIGRGDEAKLVKAGGEKYFPVTLGRIAKIILNGGSLPDYAMKNFDTAFFDGKERSLAAKAEVAPRKFKEEPRLNEKNVALLEPIMVAIEKMDKKFDLTKALDGVDGAKLLKVAQFLEAEYDHAKKEVPSFDTTQAKIDKALTYHNKIVDETFKLAGKTRGAPVKVVKPRKPRKKKVISPDRLVMKVAVAPEFPELKLKSIAPKEIIGAKALWLYDTRYSKLTVLRGEALSVKGSTVINFDEGTSMSKRCGRKAALITDNVIKAGKVALRHIFDDIKTAPITFTGRLNANIILLRVEK